MKTENNTGSTEIAIIKAEENGVTITTVSRENGEMEPTLRLDEGEVYMMILNPSVRGYLVRGKVEVQTVIGTIKGHASIIVESHSAKS